MVTACKFDVGVSVCVSVCARVVRYVAYICISRMAVGQKGARSEDSIDSRFYISFYAYIYSYIIIIIINSIFI